MIKKFLFILLGVYVGYIVCDTIHYNKNFIINKDSINYNIIDSIQYNIIIKDSFIVNLKSKRDEAVKEIVYINDSASVELFKQLVSE